MVLAILLVISVGAVFAQSGEFRVQAVAGKVERLVSDNSWEPVTKGMSLAENDTVSTGLNSLLVIKDGRKTVVIDSLKKGTLEELAAASSSGKKGIRTGAGAVKSDAAKKTGPDRTSVSTASTRASIMTNDIDWKEAATDEPMTKNAEIMEDAAEEVIEDTTVTE